jgi:Putative F0F1-ATPase subunit Ca2+/Mg2+ transporter
VGKVSQKGDEEPIPEPALPARPRLPDPPKLGYQRPRPIEDPAERFLARRGIGSRDAGSMGKAMGVGTALVGSIIGGVVLGLLADKFLIKSVTPYGLIVGFLLGTISGFANLIKLANELNK